jgi:hypothetical protein
MNRWQNAPPLGTPAYRGLVVFGLLLLAGGMIASAEGIDAQFVSKATAAEGGRPVLTPERGGEATPIPPGMQVVPEGQRVISGVMTFHGGVTFAFGNEIVASFKAFRPALHVLGATPQVHVFKDTASLYRDGPAVLGVDERFLAAHVNKYTQAAIIPSNWNEMRGTGQRASNDAMVFVQSNMTDPYRDDEAYGAQRRKQLVFATMLLTDQLKQTRYQYSLGEIFQEGFRKDLGYTNRLWTDNAPGDREMLQRWSYALSSPQQAWATVGSWLMAPSTNIKENDEFYRIFDSSIWMAAVILLKIKEPDAIRGKAVREMLPGLRSKKEEEEAKQGRGQER